MPAYYNEIDPYAAQWLRNLIAAGYIAPGDVDERSITDVKPDDLRGYEQCHFFAGIGGWSYALRLAGWLDDRPVWTGSCPCQPFSAAGKQRGSDDERHLWPAFFDLIRERRPASVFGEQVAGAAGLAWLDHVCADLEGAGYAAAAANLCAAGAGAPHSRQRLYWVADADGWHSGAEWLQRRGQQRQQPAHGGAGLLGDAFGEGLEIERMFPGVSRGASGAGAGQAVERADPLAAWADLAWIECSDGKARPTQPSLFPLAHGIPNRVGRLRAYGNAIVPQVAAAFIKACG
jgi:DNA (cytosine-5)-methyltransferase 1